MSLSTDLFCQYPLGLLQWHYGNYVIHECGQETKHNDTKRIIYEIYCVTVLGQFLPGHCATYWTKTLNSQIQWIELMLTVKPILHLMAVSNHKTFCEGTTVQRQGLDCRGGGGMFSYITNIHFIYIYILVHFSIAISQIHWAHAQW